MTGKRRTSTTAAFAAALSLSLGLSLLAPSFFGSAIAGPLEDDFRKAAELDNAAAQFNLGTLYGSGRGVAVNAVEAYQWLSLASSRFAASDEQRTRAIQNCTLVASLMTGAQIAEAQQKASTWKPI